MAFDPTSKWLAAGGSDTQISLFAVDRGFEKLMELNCSCGVMSLSWSSDSRFLLSAGQDMRVTMWNAVSCQVVMQTPKAKDWYCAVVFCPDMSGFATCGYSDYSVRVHGVQIEEEEDNDRPSSAKPPGAPRQVIGVVAAPAGPEEPSKKTTEDAPVIPVPVPVAPPVVAPPPEDAAAPEDEVEEDYVDDEFASESEGE